MCRVTRKSHISHERMPQTTCCRGLVSVDIDDRLDEGLGNFLRQIKPDAARDDAERIAPENFLAETLASGCGAPLASPSSFIVCTVMTGPVASLFSSSS
jgi:hypothetical protein